MEDLRVRTSKNKFNRSDGSNSSKGKTWTQGRAAAYNSFARVLGFYHLESFKWPSSSSLAPSLTKRRTHPHAETPRAQKPNPKAAALNHGPPKSYLRSHTLLSWNPIPYEISFSIFDIFVVVVSGVFVVSRSERGVPAYSACDEHQRRWEAEDHVCSHLYQGYRSSSR